MPVFGRLNRLGSVASESTHVGRSVLRLSFRLQIFKLEVAQRLQAKDGSDPNLPVSILGRHSALSPQVWNI